jgi:hypothetical protein
MNDIRKAISIVENPNINSNKKISRHKFASVFFQSNEERRKYTLLMFEKLLNDKKKFFLDNHFDRKHCKKFLYEKDKYLSEMVFDDEPPQNQQAIKNNESRKTLDISIPNSPHKFSFKQK